MGDDGVSFAGNGATDSTIQKSGTEPPSGGSGSNGGGVQFSGKGAEDVHGFSSDTSQHDPSKNSPSQEGKGVEFVS